MIIVDETCSRRHPHMRDDSACVPPGSVLKRQMSCQGLTDVPRKSLSALTCAGACDAASVSLHVKIIAKLPTLSKQRLLVQKRLP